MVQEYADLDRGLGDDCVRVVTIVRADDGGVVLEEDGSAALAAVGPLEYP